MCIGSSHLLILQAVKHVTLHLLVEDVIRAENTQKIFSIHEAILINIIAIEYSPPFILLLSICKSMDELRESNKIILVCVVESEHTLEYEAWWGMLVQSNRE